MEEIRVSFNIHPVAYLGGYFGFGLTFLLGIVGLFVFWPIGLLLMAIGIIGIAFIEVSRRAHKLILTEDGVLEQYKFITVNKTFAEYRVIQDIQVKQSLIERLHGAGTIYVNTSGSLDQEIIFRSLPRCFEVESAIRNQMKKHSPVDTSTPGAVR